MTQKLLAVGELAFGYASREIGGLEFFSFMHDFLFVRYINCAEQRSWLARFLGHQVERDQKEGLAPSDVHLCFKQHHHTYS